MNISNHLITSLTNGPSSAAELTRTAATGGDTNFQDILRSASSQNDPNKIKHAAKQFEGLIIGQILKSVHEASNEGWMGTGEDQSGSTAIELAEEQFAQAMANGGGLGLAKMVEKGLASRSKTASSVPTQP
jgi:peptidoglycan hydrolase FlgJ